jgi:hypothetical protein
MGENKTLDLKDITLLRLLLDIILIISISFNNFQRYDVTILIGLNIY